MMKPRAWKWFFALCVALTPLLAFMSACHRRTRPLYAVIPKGQAHIYWQTVHAGAAAAAAEAGVDIDWNGPAMETDFSRQIAITDDFINRHVDGILLAPTDREALVPAIHRAAQAGIPLSIFDSAANTNEYVSFVATDNYGGGVMAAKRLAEILHEKGNVAMIAVVPGGASTLAREQGFTDTLAKEFPNIKLVAQQYGMSDRARSLAVSEDILTAHPDLDGMFASNESSAIGAAQAIKERGLAGKVKMVGFDSSPSLNDDLRAGIIDSLVLQDPFQIGYQGLKTLLDHHAGKPVPKTIALPPVLVTHDNMNDPKIQQLLNPDIARYLKISKP
ncbi:MAG TPA: substrate-binding domain-containing protein [Terriglobia bacterium]|nr:substrate-binding domain-containing protein [Terriglobia bacterium]